MFGLMNRSSTAKRDRRVRSATKGAVVCECLEGRELLSAGFGFPSFGGGNWGSREAGFAPGARGVMARGFGVREIGSISSSGRLDSLLISPRLEAAGGQTGFPSSAALSSSAVQQATQTLQTDLKNDTPNGAQPTFASIGALQDDLQSVRKGTLSGSAAQSKIATDDAAILTSMGLSQSQITQIQTDAQAVVTAIQSSSSSSTSTSSGTTTTTTSTTTGSPTSTGTSALQSALQTLQSDLKTDIPTGTHPTHASVGAVLDDLAAIRKGTLSGGGAVTKVQTDTAALLSSMGLTQTQISQIQSDQQAVQSAGQADSSAPASSSTSTSSSTLQSVSPYLVGIPGVSGFGMRGFGGVHGGMRMFFRH